MATNCRSPVCFRTLWRCRFSPAAISAFAAASCTRLCSIPRMTISRRLTAYAWPKPSPNVKRAVDETRLALDRAIPVFWKHGFANTTLQHLEPATGVNKSGLYSEFKDKEDLFLASLARHE